MQHPRQRALGSEFCLDARAGKFKLNVAVGYINPPKDPEPEHLDPAYFRIAAKSSL
jgi:hypothetical protein